MSDRGQRTRLTDLPGWDDWPPVEENPSARIAIQHELNILLERRRDLEAVIAWLEHRIEAIDRG